MRSVKPQVSSARRIGAAAVVMLALGALTVSAQRPKFYKDDPIAREPDSQDASAVKAWRIPLGYDILLNLFAHPGEIRDVRAMDVNTIDEVPDSSWFTNRILARPVSVEELVRGPMESAGPAAGRMTVVRAKPAGAAPGFVVRDSAGVTWFVQFNTPKNPEAATAAAMVANKLFWALGYWQTENHLATRRMDEFDIDPKARVETPSGRDRQLDMDDLKTILGHANREADASYRMLASRAIPGRVLGGFKYFGTRPDDPNDVIPHEHRRVLRALQVFGAWTNLTDSKAGNTPRHAAHRERQVVRAALPAGRRLHLRHRRARGARLRRGLRVHHRREPGVEAPAHLRDLPAAVAVGAVRGVSGGRPLPGRASSTPICGSRGSPTPRCRTPAPTTSSGRRGG